MATILVQMADHQWTVQAMHLACSAARNTGYELVLLHLLSVKNPGLLGSSVATGAPTSSEWEDIEDYALIAEDYGITLRLQPMTYTTLIDALAQAAEVLQPTLMFAHIPNGRIHWLHRVRLWLLERQLARVGCALSTLEQHDQYIERVPEIVMRTPH